jgi:hypothetical protein
VFTGDAHRLSGERLDLPVNSSRLPVGGRSIVRIMGPLRLVVSLLVLAIAAPPAVAFAGQTSSPPAVSEAERSLIGVIERFEEAARRLVLQTKDAHVAFILASDAVVRLGSHTLSASELDTHRGRRAKVRYTQDGNRRTAHWVVISSEAPRSTY